MSEEVKPEMIEKTQRVLGKYISKPALSEKLLKKPPFRFLHDVVTAVIKDTGFLKGLFNETELISTNVKERDMKIAFLTKLIEAIKLITEIDLKVKSTKIIAGLEPAETNKLLQAIGYALDKKIDSTEYVRRINSKLKASEKTKKKLTKASVKEEKKDSVRTKKVPTELTKVEKPKKKVEGNSEDKGSSEEMKRKSKKDKDKKEMKIKISPPTKNEDIESNRVDSHLNINENEEVANYEKTNNANKKDKDEINDKVSPRIKEEIKTTENMTLKGTNDSEDTTILEQNEETITTKNTKSRSDRPKSARPQSGDLRKAVSTKIDNIEENITAQRNVPARPTTSLRPPSVRPSSARPGAPRLRPDSALPLHEMVPLGKINVIVENYNMKEMDEEETVVIQNSEMEIEQVQTFLDIPEDKGHLVEQILEQIHDSDVAEHASVKNKNEIDWESEGFHNKDAVNREISQLRSQIQSLTKVANPLGKLMNYLHEDIESMFTELNMWVNMKREMHKEINKQKKNNEDSSKPLILHLQELEESIKKQETEIVNFRSNILRNESRIKDLLTK